jgi:hypothetical protein
MNTGRIYQDRPVTPSYCAEGGGGPFRGCKEVVSLLHPLPTDWDAVRCPMHRKEGDVTRYADD